MSASTMERKCSSICLFPMKMPPGFSSFMLLALKSIMLFSLVILSCGTTSADSLTAIDHYNRAVDYAYEGEYLLALNETDRALAENPEFSLAHITRAGILNSLARYDESLTASDQAIGLNPNQSGAWNNRAYALVHLGRYEESLDASDRAISLDPDLTEAWINKGTALIALGRYNEALDASKNAAEIDPFSSDAKENKRIAEAAFNTPPPTSASLPFLVILVAGLFGAGLMALTTKARI